MKKTAPCTAGLEDRQDRQVDVTRGCTIHSQQGATAESESNTAVQSKKAVSAYFTSKQILPFGLAEKT